MGKSQSRLGSPSQVSSAVLITVILIIIIKWQQCSEPRRDSCWHTDGGILFPAGGLQDHPQGPPWPIQGVWPLAVKGPGQATLSHLCLFPDQFEVVPLQFSKDLDAHNPNTPEWREDVGLVVSRLLSKVSGSPMAEPPPFLGVVGTPGEWGAGAGVLRAGDGVWGWAGCPAS